ncbi:MAG: CHAT domain-containing protein/tetratricopeptide (TPR) repeat protein [Glaciecola sp.]|jgi:CHAT domain-containing protein/tetratricopeptide (TPR) repeat protein
MQLALPLLLALTLALAASAPALAALQEPELPQVLVPGKTIEAEITDAAPEVHTPTLDASYTKAPTVGIVYRIVVDESGPYHIDLRSYDFDAYLTLRDVEGSLLAEDDDGLISVHSRLVIDLERGETYELTACALHGLRGDIRLDLRAGTPATVSPREKAQLKLTESRAVLAQVEMKLGPDHRDTATGLNNLAALLQAMGEYTEARLFLERSLAIYEAQLGPYHLDTATGLNNLAALLYLMDEYTEAQPLYERSLAIREFQLGPDHPSTGQGLGSLAALLYLMGEYTEARPLYERSLAIYEAQLGPNHPRTALGLGNLALLLKAMGEYTEARPLYERSLAIREAQLGPDHPDTATSLNNLAGLLQVMGEYTEARPLYERSVAIYEAQLGPDHPDTATGLGNQALLLKAMGNYTEARPLYERALAIREAQLGPDHPKTAQGLGNLASLLQAMGKYTEARPLYERALAIEEAQRGPDHPRTAVSLNDLALLLQAMGEYTEARPLVERSLAIREAQQGPDHPRTATSLANLASLLQAMGEYTEARPLFERSLAIREAQLGPDHLETAQVLGSLAILLKTMGDYTEARPLYERSLAIYEAQLGPDHSYTAASLNNLAALLETMGEYAEARPLYERALAIDEAQLGPDHPYTATSLNNLALLLKAMGKYTEARPLYERSLAIREVQLGPDHPDTASSLNNLAALLLDLREPARAWELIRRAEGGMGEHLRSILTARTRDESRKYLSRKRWQLELLVSVPRVYESQRVESESASSVLAWKGQVGRAARQVRKLSRESSDARDVTGRLRARQEELSLLAYDTELASGARERRIVAVKKKVVELEVELRSLVGVQVPEEFDALDAEALSERLPANAALLSFFVHHIYAPARYEEDEVVEKGHWIEPHLVAWIVRPGSEVVSVDLGLAERIETQTKSFLDGLVASRGIAVRDESEDHNAALRASLWTPLVEHLGDASLVIISHDRFTATLPFEVLSDESGRYLIEDYSFVALHDLQAIGGFEEDVTSEYDSLFCVGGVNFNNRDEPDLQAVADTRGDNDAPTERWQFWGSLDATRSEVTTIRDMHAAFVRDGSRSLVTGPQATEERVLAEMPNASIVHLATHGYFQPEGLPSMWQAAQDETERLRGEGGAHIIGGMLETDRKLTGYMPEVLSGLVLAGANTEREEGRLDGYLTAADVDWMDLSGVELVTLSACETGLGRSQSGEGMSGFRTTLLRAGAKTVVTSLWKVPDDATQKLMVRFYENLLRNKMGKLEALRDAQLWMLRENRRTHGGDGRPHAWGAFVLSGDWR